MRIPIRTLLLGSALALATAALTGCGSEQYKKDQTPDTFGQRAQEGKPIYQPPPGAPVPGGRPPGGPPR